MRSHWRRYRNGTLRYIEQPRVVVADLTDWVLGESMQFSALYDNCSDPCERAFWTIFFHELIAKVVAHEG